MEDGVSYFTNKEVDLTYLVQICIGYVILMM